jgi:hypothetical protein
MESERRHAERRREVNRLEWCAYHRQQAERHRVTLAALITHHEDQAQKLERDRTHCAQEEKKSE